MGESSDAYAACMGATRCSTELLLYIDCAKLVFVWLKTVTGLLEPILFKLEEIKLECSLSVFTVEMLVYHVLNCRLNSNCYFHDTWVVHF